LKSRTRTLIEAKLGRRFVTAKEKAVRKATVLAFFEGVKRPRRAPKTFKHIFF
jgi:hypothetical protein